MFKGLGKIKFLGLLVVLLVQIPVSASSPINIQIEGISQSIQADAGKPYIIQGTTMVPLAFVSKSLGHEVQWNAKDRQVSIDNGQIILTVDNKRVFVKDKSITLDIAPTIKGSRTYVPLRFVSSALGYEVDYKNKTVNITGKGNSNDIKPSVNIDQFAKSKGYGVEEQKSIDLNGDGVKDYVAILTKSWEGQLVIVDGATGEALATQKISPGEYGTSLHIYNIQGSYHIMCTAHDKQPWQGLYQWKDGKLKSHGDTLNEKFDVKLEGKNIVAVMYPQSVYNQDFTISNDVYKYLMADASWYAHSVGSIENSVLAINKEIRLPGISNSGQFEIIEKYNWDGNNWVLGGVTYNTYSDDFKKTTSEVEPQKTRDVLDWIAQGEVDTIPYRIGDPIADVIKILGSGNPWTMQAIRVRTYGNYSINESVYEPIVAGFTFAPGFELYGIKIGDSAKEIEAKLGKTYTKGDVGEGDELSPEGTLYNHYYQANNNTLRISFDKNDKSTLAWFIAF